MKAKMRTVADATVIAAVTKEPMTVAELAVRLALPMRTTRRRLEALTDAGVLFRTYEYTPTRPPVGRYRYWVDRDRKEVKP